jgi:hypothetical protein
MSSCSVLVRPKESRRVWREIHADAGCAISRAGNTRRLSQEEARAIEFSADIPASSMALAANYPISITRETRFAD